MPLKLYGAKPWQEKGEKGNRLTVEEEEGLLLRNRSDETVDIQLATLV
jgi:hypothetical protein